MKIYKWDNWSRIAEILKIEVLISKTVTLWGDTFAPMANQDTNSKA